MLKNDPVIWALSEVSAIFLHIKELDFVISLGTSKPRQKNYKVSTEDCHDIQKNGMFQRLHSLILEKMRDKSVRRAYKIVRLAAQIFYKIPHLSINFNKSKPRLNSTKSIPKLIAKVETDRLLSTSINEVMRCLITSLFYFKLDLLPERYDSKYIFTGHILCLI